MNEITETYVNQISVMVLSNVAAVDTLHIYGNLNPSGCPTSYFNADGVRSRNWSTIPDELVSYRLTELLNIYWDASRWVDTKTRTSQQNHRRALWNPSCQPNNSDCHPQQTNIQSESTIDLHPCALLRNALRPWSCKHRCGSADLRTRHLWRCIFFHPEQPLRGPFQVWSFLALT